MVFDAKYDCIVVGGGNAGFSAAHAAMEGGCLSVLIVDSCSEEFVGGNSYFTAGAFRISHDGLDDLLKTVEKLPPELGTEIDIPPYRAVDFTDDILRMSQSQSDPVMVKELVSSSNETINWLKSYVGVPFVLSYNRQAFLVNGRQKFWGGMALATKDGGKGLMQAHLQKAREEGVTFWYNCPAIELIASSTSVHGLIVRHNGIVKHLQAHGVVLACGGFEANLPRRVEYLGPTWAYAKVRGTPYNTGDGFCLAAQVQACKIGDKRGCHSTCWDANAPSNSGDRKLTNQYTKSGYPLGIMVNVNGKRFADEGEDMRNYTYAKLGRIINEQPQGIAWQVWDSKTAPLLRVEEYGDAIVTKIRADTLDMLAEKLVNDGLNHGREFLDTIETFNAAVLQNRKEHPLLKFDPSIKDNLSTQSSQIQLVPPKSHWAQTISDPPFIAVKVACGITFTFYGLQIDPRTASVIGQGGRQIEGLYCAGELVGGLFYNNYPGGSGLTAGAVWGRRAGQSIAKEVKSKNMSV